jgi:hypothetical protein
MLPKSFMGYQPSSLTLPFLGLNLKRNPFGELTRGERASLALVPPLVVGSGEVVQVLGEAGRGKTTHLLAWHVAHPGSEYEYLAEGESRLKTRDAGDPFFVDEAQRLDERELERLFRTVPRLVLGTHRDLSAHTTRLVRTLEVAGLNAQKLCTIVQLRIEASRRAPGPVPTLSAESLTKLIACHGDDLRSIEARLYDAFQRHEGTGRVEV